MPSSPSATCYITFEFSLGFEIKIICLPSIIPRLIVLDSPFIPYSSVPFCETLSRTRNKKEKRKLKNEVDEVTRKVESAFGSEKVQRKICAAFNSSKLFQCR